MTLAGDRGQIWHDFLKVHSYVNLYSEDLSRTLSISVECFWRSSVRLDPVGCILKMTRCQQCHVNRTAFVFHRKPLRISNSSWHTGGRGIISKQDCAQSFNIMGTKGLGKPVPVN